MKRKNTALALLAVGCWLLAVGAAEAQFGKNKVVYEDMGVLFYQSEHADFYHWQDVKDEKQIKHLAHVVRQVELSNSFLSDYLKHSLSKRPNVVFYRTQSTFAATRIIGDHFIPEGVLAFALPTPAQPTRYILAIKLDLSVEEYDVTITHEMAHIFQFDKGPNILRRLMGNGPPHWIMEGGAEFLANEFNGSRTDDLRKTVQRGAGANPEKDLPTWLELNAEAADPYTFGPMTLEFIKEKYGEEVVKVFLIRSFSDGEDLIKVLAELTVGAVRSPEQFDEAQRDYWREKFGPEMLAKPRPYQENEYFRGRYVASRDYPNPIIDPVVSPDGKRIAVLTPSQKYVSIVLAVIPALPREIPEYVSIPKLKEGDLESLEKEKRPVETWEIEIMTPYIPPKHYEHIALDLSASNLSWTRAGDKEYIVFFAQSGKDHKLYIVNPDKRKELRSIPIPLDNALSPAISPDGTKVYFTASQGTFRDIYEVELAAGSIRNITNDKVYEESPAVSPDGTQIAHVSFWGSFRKLFLLNLATGEKRQLTFNAFNDHAPRFSDDGKTLVYTSDEKDGVSNIYTIDLETNLVSQLTDFFGRSFTPRFARGENDRIYYVHLWQYAQYRYFIGQKFELFEVLTKKPYRQYVMRDNSEQNSVVFMPDRDLFEFELDENQLLNPTPAPEKWACGGGQIAFGVSTYWGMFGQSYFRCSNLLETKQHSALFLSRGDFRILDYFYSNREKRTGWVWGAHQYRMPYYVRFYDVVHRYPAQYVLNNTWITETALDLHTEYPLSKFKRFELYSRLRNRSFNLFGYGVNDLSEDVFRDNPDFTSQDGQVLKFLKDSAGSNLSFGAAYAIDTVLGSYSTGFPPYIPAPFHGNALRAQIEFAPPLGEEFQGYTSASVSARAYRHLGTSSTFAVRGDLMTTTRANGDIVLFCGPEYGRGCEYGSVAGNQVAYGSVELRFPLPGTYLLGLPVRAFLFNDMFYAKFSDSSRFPSRLDRSEAGNEAEEKFPAKKLNIPGLGLHYIIPVIGLPAQNIWRLEDGKWKPSFYVTVNW